VLADSVGDIGNWSTALTDYQSLAELQQAQRQATAFLAPLNTVRQWVNQARTQRFFDGGYDRAQLLLSLWQPLGDRRYQGFQDWAAVMSSFSSSGQR
jgi:hypothetical protein